MKNQNFHEITIIKNHFKVEILLKSIQAMFISLFLSKTLTGSRKGNFQGVSAYYCIRGILSFIYNLYLYIKTY